MKKNVYLTIITIITVLAIVLGVLWRFTPLTGISPPWEHTERSSEDSDRDLRITKTWGAQELGDCQSIHLSLDAADVVLETGGQSEIRFEGNEKIMPEVRAENGQWTVKQKEKKTYFTDVQDLYENNRLVITVPEGSLQELVELDADAGNVDMKGLHVQTLSIEVDAGDLDLEKMEIQKLVLDVDAGDIDVLDTTFTEGKIDADMGNVKVMNGVFNDVSVDLDAGDVEIHSAVSLEDADLNLNVDMGEIRVNGQSSGKAFQQQGASGTRLSVAADLGDIQVSW